MTSRRVVSASGETLTWSRKGLGYSRYRLGHKLSNRYKPKSRDVKEHGRMKKIIVVLEEGIIPVRRVFSNKMKEKRSKSRGEDICI